MAEVNSVVLLVPLIIFGIGLVCLLSCVAFTCCVMQKRRYQRERELARLAALGVSPQQGGVSPRAVDDELNARPGTIIGTNHGGTQQVVVAQPPQPRYQGEIEGDLRRLSLSTNPARDFMRHGVPLSYCTTLHMTPQEILDITAAGTGTPATNTNPNISNAVAQGISRRAHRRSSSAPEPLVTGAGTFVDGHEDEADLSILAEAAPLPPGAAEVNETHAQPAFAPQKSILHSFASRLGSSFASFLNLSSDRPLYSLPTRGLVGYQQTNTITTGEAELMERSAGGYNTHVRERIRQLAAEHQPLTVVTGPTDNEPMAGTDSGPLVTQRRDLASSMSGVLQRNGFRRDADSDATPVLPPALRPSNAWEDANFMRTSTNTAMPSLVPIIQGLQIPSSPAFLPRRGSRRSVADSLGAPVVPSTPMNGNSSLIWNSNMALSLRETPMASYAAGSPILNSNTRYNNNNGNGNIVTFSRIGGGQETAGSPYSNTHVTTLIGAIGSPQSPVPLTITTATPREPAGSAPPVNPLTLGFSSPTGPYTNPLGMISSASQSTVVAKTE